MREAWAGGRPAFGLWSMLPGPSFAVELLSAARPDYVCVDGQHGLAGLAAGATPLVRVPRNDPADIGKVLDAGARGVIVPLVNDASEAPAPPGPAAIRRTATDPTGRCGPRSSSERRIRELWARRSRVS